jgi:hypothetical protein
MPDPLTIAASAWAWDKYGKSLTDKAASVLKGRWDKFRWNDAAEKYRAKDGECEYKLEACDQID